MYIVVDVEQNDKSNSLPVRYSLLKNGALLSIYHSTPEAKHNPANDTSEQKSNEKCFLNIVKQRM